MQKLIAVFSLFFFFFSEVSSVAQRSNTFESPYEFDKIQQEYTFGENMNNSTFLFFDDQMDASSPVLRISPGIGDDGEGQLDESIQGMVPIGDNICFLLVLAGGYVLFSFLRNVISKKDKKLPHSCLNFLHK